MSYFVTCESVYYAGQEALRRQPDQRCGAGLHILAGARAVARYSVREITVRISVRHGSVCVSVGRLCSWYCGMRGGMCWHAGARVGLQVDECWRRAAEWL